jgi:hypothetical protein
MFESHKIRITIFDSIISMDNQLSLLASIIQSISIGKGSRTHIQIGLQYVQSYDFLCQTMCVKQTKFDVPNFFILDILHPSKIHICDATHIRSIVCILVGRKVNIKLMLVETLMIKGPYCLSVPSSVIQVRGNKNYFKKLFSINSRTKWCLASTCL